MRGHIENLSARCNSSEPQARAKHICRSIYTCSYRSTIQKDLLLFEQESNPKTAKILFTSILGFTITLAEPSWNHKNHHRNVLSTPWKMTPWKKAGEGRCRGSSHRPFWTWNLRSAYVDDKTCIYPKSHEHANAYCCAGRILCNYKCTSSTIAKRHKR